MKHPFLITTIILTAGLGVGCATLGMLTPSDLIKRQMAFNRCAVASAAAGLSGISTIKDVKAQGDHSKETQVLNAVTTIGTSNLPANVAAACEETLGYGLTDAKAAHDAVKAKAAGKTSWQDHRPRYVAAIGFWPRERRADCEPSPCVLAMFGDLQKVLMFTTARL